MDKSGTVIGYHPKTVLFRSSWAASNSPFDLHPVHFTNNNPFQAKSRSS